MQNLYIVSFILLWTIPNSLSYRYAPEYDYVEPHYGDYESNPLEYEYEIEHDLRHVAGNVAGRNFFTDSVTRLIGTVGGTVISTVNSAGQALENIDDRIGFGGYGLLGIMGYGLTKLSDILGGGVRFYLYTLRNKYGEEITARSFDTETWDKTANTTVIIHGFSPSGYLYSPYDNLLSLIKVKDALLDIKSTDNIIMVDWTSISSSGIYTLAATSTATASERTTSLLVLLVSKGYIPSPKHITLIGHSLGGHTAGLVGRDYEDRTKEKIGTIIGLDPAGPGLDMFAVNSARVEWLRPKQLYKEYADFVQVIHCDKSFLGTNLNRGHVDFWPNGGENMPGCTGYHWTQSAIGHVCSHSRCMDLFVDTFYHDEHIGCKCDSYEEYNAGSCPCGTEDMVKMGRYCPRTATGAYYMNITAIGNYDKSSGDGNDLVRDQVEKDENSQVSRKVAAENLESTIQNE